MNESSVRAEPPPPDVFDELAEVERQRRVVAARRLVLIARACDEYEVHEDDLGNDTALDAALLPHPAGERRVQVGADGTPDVGEFLRLELAGLLRCSEQSATIRMAEALNLRHRHPLLWRAVTETLTVEAWQAAAVVDACVAAGLSHEQCLGVDGALASAVSLIGWARARRLLNGLIVRADPELAARRADEKKAWRGVTTSRIRDGEVVVEARLGGLDGVQLEATVARIAFCLGQDGDTDSLQHRRARALGMLAVPHLAAAFLEEHGGRSASHVDPAKLRPRATLVVHVHADTVNEAEGNPGVARIEGHGAIDRTSLGRLLRGCEVTVRPVVDLNAPPATDAYEIPDRLRDHVLTRNPVEVFPWSGRVARRCDLDHTTPFDHAAARGALQTRADNLGPLGRRAHRAKTSGWLALEQLEPGVFIARTRAGFRYLVTALATIPLGRSRPEGVLAAA